MVVDAFSSTYAVVRDVSIELTPLEVAQAQHGGRDGPSLKPQVLAAAQEAIEAGMALIEPVAIWAEFAVCDVIGEEVYLWHDAASEARSLAVGPKIELIAPARRVVVAVSTIGPALERRVHELNDNGEMLLAYMLDCVGVMALGAVGEALRERVERRALELGWGVSPLLSPGSLVGWPLHGQREICSLLPLSEIGVRLTERCVLQPHKSASMVVGLGPDYPSAHVESVCRYCSLADHCWRRWGKSA